MSKLSMIKRNKRQRALVLKFMMYPQRIFIPSALMEKPLHPDRDRLWSIPDDQEPTTGPYGPPLADDIFRRHVNPYGRSADL